MSSTFPASLPQGSPCVHKFGGSSFADAACLARVSRILSEAAEPAQLIVVSALQGVTNALVALTDSIDDPSPALAALLQRHLALAAAIGDAELHAWLELDFGACATQLALARQNPCRGLAAQWRGDAPQPHHHDHHEDYREPRRSLVHALS